MLAAKVFGLEESILQKCESQEVSRFKRILIFFFVLLTIGCISFYYLFFLLSANYFIAMLGCGLLGYIFYTILRFTIISISVPITEAITLKRMMFNPANIFRMVLFSAFLFAMLVPFTALLNHTQFTQKLNEYKSVMYTKYVSNKDKAKAKQLSLIQQAINRKTEERKHLTELLNQSKSTIDIGIANFQIAKIDSSIVDFKNKLVEKDSIISVDNLNELEQFSSTLKIAEMPFFRFRLVFSDKKTLFLFALLFILFFTIIPLYIRVLVSKNSNYDNLFSEMMIDRIVTEYKSAKKDCSDHYKRKYAFQVSDNQLYEDSPFNTKPKSLAFIKVKGVNLFSHFEKLKNDSGKTQL